MRIFEFTAFLALSGALHAATLVVAPLPGGASSGGEGGAADVTLRAATPTLAAMVQDWDRPPEVSNAPTLLQPEMTTAPERPTADPRPDIRAPLTALASPSAPPDRPQAETRLPAPPVPLAAPAPDALALPDTGNPGLPNLPSASTSHRLATPQLAAPTEIAQTEPQLDTSPAESRTAPIASLRPELRPDVVTAKPAPARTPQSAPRPAQTAKGSGSKPTTATASTRAAPVASGPSKAQLARLEQQWGAQITSALRRAHRPPRGTAGTVKLVIAITPAGQVAGVSLAASSGNSRLDQAALAAVNRARFPRAPEGLTKSSYRFSQRLTVSR